MPRAAVNRLAVTAAATLAHALWSGRENNPEVAATAMRPTHLRSKGASAVMPDRAKASRVPVF